MADRRPFLNLIRLKLFRVYPLLEPQVLFHGNGLAIWQGLPDAKHIEVNNKR